MRPGTGVMWMRFPLVIAVLSVMLLVGCTCSGPASSGDQGGETVDLADVDTSHLPAWLLEAAQPVDEELPVTSEELILAAYDEERIDFDEYLTLRFQAAFEPERLPEAYAGEEGAHEAGAGSWDHPFLFAQLRTRWDELSPETQERLRTYVLPAEDPESFWYEEEENVLTEEEAGVKLAGPAERIVDWLTLVPAAEAVVNKNALGESFEIHYGDGMTQQAQWVAAALNHAHAKFLAAGFPEPKEWVYVKVKTMPANVFGEEGLANRSGKERCHIHIKSGMDKRMTETTTAHELFHCFQEYIPLQAYENEGQWIWESSAVWSEEYAYPQHNTEHTMRDRLTWKIFHRPLFDVAGTNEYSRYLWWFYLSQKAGKSAAPVKETLFAAKPPSDQRKALESRPDFLDEHKEYALWGLNSDPYQYYQDSDGYPKERPNGYSKKEILVEKGKKNKLDADLQPGAIRYLYYFVNDDVEKIEFDLRELNREANEKGGVQMIYSLGDGTVYRDVSDEEEVVFCRNREMERVHAVLFIVNNADLETLHIGSLPFDASEECKPEWSGGITISWSASNSVDQETLSGDMAHGTWSERGAISSRETLVYDKEWDEFLVAEQEFSYDYNEEELITYDRECGYLSEGETHWEKGGGHGVFDIDEEYVEYSDAPTRLRGIEDAPGTYELDLSIVSGTATTHSESFTERKPCGLEGIFTPGAGEGGRDVFDNEYDTNAFYSIINFPNVEMVVRLSEDRKRLTGEGEAWFQYGNTKVPVEISVEYAYR